MDVESGPIEGLKIVRLKLFHDSRGFFTERFHQSGFEQAGLPWQFVQDNHSRSLPGVLRGLHFQHTPSQGKLVGVIRGRIWDVAVDVRPHSSTFGKHHALELNDRNGLLFWIPEGFAHGFCVLGDEPADVFYKVDRHYSPGGDVGIRFDDPDIQIPWPIQDPILSDRDRALPSWSTYVANPICWETL